MNMVIAYALLLGSVYCSFKLAKEKQQHHIIWPVVTAVLGPGVFIIQYLATTLIKKKQFN